jgi:hypothetical protein
MRRWITGAIKITVFVGVDGLCIEGVEGVNYEDTIETVNIDCSNTEIQF